MSQGETYKGKQFDDYLKMGLLGVSMMGIGGRVAARTARAVIPWIGNYYGRAPLARSIMSGVKSAKFVTKKEGPGKAIQYVAQGKPFSLAKLEYQRNQLQNLIARKQFGVTTSYKDYKSVERARNSLEKINLKFKKQIRSDHPHATSFSGPIAGKLPSHIGNYPGQILTSDKAGNFPHLMKATAVDGKTKLGTDLWKLKDKTKINHFEIVDRAHLGELARIAKSDERFRFLQWGLNKGLTPHEIMNPTKKLLRESGIKLSPKINHKTFMQGVGINKVGGKLNVSYVPSRIERRPWLEDVHHTLRENIGDTTVAGHTVNVQFVPSTRSLLNPGRKLYNPKPASMTGFDKTDYTGTLTGRLLDPLLGRPTFMTWNLPV